MTPRRLAATFGVLVLGDVLAKLLGLFAYAALGRRLGGGTHGAYGALEAAMAAVFIASLCVEGGLAPYGARLVGAEPGSARRLLARIGLLRLGYVVVAAAGLGAYVLIAKPPAAVATLIGWYALTLVPYALYAEWLFQGRNEPWWVTPPQVGRNLFLWIAAIGFIHGPEDAWLAPVADGAGFLAGVLVQQLVARRSVGRPDFTPPLALLGLAGASFPILVSGLAFVFRIFYPMVLAGDVADASVSDAYGAAHRLFVSIHAVVPLFCINLLPTWARAWAAGDRRSFFRSTGAAVALFIVAAAAAVVFAFSDAPRVTLDLVYADRFSSGDLALAWLALAVGLLGLSAVPRFAFIAIGRPRLDTASNLCGAATVALLSVYGDFWIGSQPEAFAHLVIAGEAVAGLVAWLAALFAFRRRKVH